MFTRFIAFLLVCHCFLFASIDVIQKIDAHSRLLSEKWDNGAFVNYTYSENEATIEISGFGKIKYVYNGTDLKKVERWKGKQLIYCHDYLDEREVLIADLGDKVSKKVDHGFETTTPYSKEVCYYDENENLLQHQFDDYVETHKYDSQSRLVDDEAFDEEDTPFNSNTNDLGQLLEKRDISCEYDLNGNMIQKTTSDFVYQYAYDDDSRLARVAVGDKTVEMEYDTLNRRVGKKVYHNSELVRDQIFVYLGNNEIGSYDRISKRKELRIPGRSYHENVTLPVAIEINDKIYAPIIDAQGNVRKLIDVKTKKVVSNYDMTPFGDEVHATSSLFNPWAYGTKRFDPETKLYYFGSRYYDPQIRRWTSPDPQGWIDSPNLYTYCKNNPLKYADPNGEFVFVIPLWGAAVGVKAIIAASLTATAAVTATKIAADMSKKHKEQKQREEWARQDEEVQRQIREEKKKRNAPPSADPEAEGSPHTVIERPGPDGQYTTYTEDGRPPSQYRGSGRPHGNIPRPNVKEYPVHTTDHGTYIGKPIVRPARPDEIPKG